jgi:hypothetical protein
MFRYSLARNECVLSHSPNQIRVQTVGSVPSLPAFPLASSSSHRDCHCPHSRLARFLPARDLTCFRSDCLGDKTAVGSATIARTTTCLHCPLQKNRGQLHLCLISGLHLVSIASHNTKSSARRTYSYMLNSTFMLNSTCSASYTCSASTRSQASPWASQTHALLLLLQRV